MALAVFFAAVYGAFLSTQWIAGTPDSEYYLAIARNLAAGEGFVWNGQPVLMVPPGWPMLLAMAMTISSSMFFLNFLLYLSGLAGLIVWFFVLREITSAQRAMVIMLIVGMLFNYYRFAQHFYSESLFVPLLGATLLLAFRIRRGQAPAWHVATMLALCCALVLVRWAGVFYWPIIAAACISGQPWRRQKGAFVIAALAAVALLAAFAGTRKGIEIYAQAKREAPAVAPVKLAQATSTQPCPATATAAEKIRATASATAHATTPGTAAGTKAAAKTGTSPALEPDTLAAPADECEVRTAEPEAKAADEAPDLEWHARRTETAVARAKQNWMKRLRNCGLWLAELYWPPVQISQSSRTLTAMANVVGWIMWLLVLGAIIPRIRMGEWLWLGVLTFCLAMIFFSGMRGRYLAPAAPLLLLAAFQGIDVLRDPVRTPLWRRTGSALLYAGVGSIVVCNAFIWAVDVWALHSSRFRQVWCGGDYGAMVSITEFLARQGVGNGQIAVSRYANNFGRASASDASARLLHLLTNRTMQYPPLQFSKQPPGPKLSKWAEKQGVRYYVHRPPIDPWRLSHFRFPWLQEKITGHPVTAWNPCFVLYELVDGQLHEINVPRSSAAIATMPGL